MTTKKKQSASALKLQKITDNFRIHITDEGNNIAQANIKAVSECKTKAEMIALCMTATKNTLIIMLRNNSDFYIKEIAPTIESSWNYSKWKHDRLAEEYARCAWRAKELQELDAYLKAAEEREEYTQKETTTADHEPDTRTESSKPHIIRVMLSNPNTDKSPDTAPAQTTRKPRNTTNDDNLDHFFIECKDLHGLECTDAMRHNRQLVKAFLFIEPLIAALLTLSKQTIIFLVNDFGCGRLIKGKKKLELVTAFAKELFRRRDYEQSHTPSQPVTPKQTTSTTTTPKQEVKCDKKRQLYFSFEFDEEQSTQEKKVA